MSNRAVSTLANYDWPTMLEAVCWHAGHNPDKIALKFIQESGITESLTYQQLWQRVIGVSFEIQRHSTRGERALLLYPQGLEFIVSLLACLQAGVIAVPAYPPRKNRKLSRLTGILLDCSPSIVLTTSSLATSLPEEIVTGLKVVATDSAPAIPSDNVSVDLDPEEIAYLQYTSGSTSDPKGTMITHRAVVANIRQLATAFDLWSDWKIISWLPMYHDMGLVGAVLSPIYLGGSAVLMSPTRFLQDPFSWLKTFDDERGNVAGSPNFGFDLCTKEVRDDQLAGLDLSSIRLIVNAAEPVRADTLDQFQARFGRCGFSPEKILPCFGLAESTLLVTGGPYGQPPQRTAVDRTTAQPRLPSQDQATRWSVSCGRAAIGATVLAVDPSKKFPVDDGNIGEIWVDSPANASGYWNNLQLSQATFENYLADGSGPFLNTGDLGFILDQELYVTGRSKDLIKIRGRNIFPQDVERLIEQTLPFIDVNSCAAVGFTVADHEQIGVVIESSRDLVRISRTTQSRSELEQKFAPIVSELRAAIARECGVNIGAISFVRTGTFPRTTSGKIQRYKCRDLLSCPDETVIYSWMAGKPGIGNEVFEADNKPSPLSVSTVDTLAMSRLILAIHASLVKSLRSEDNAENRTIGCDTDFAELGVDSLAAASIIAEVEVVSGVRLSPEELYEHSTINLLARFVASKMDNLHHGHSGGHPAHASGFEHCLNAQPLRQPECIADSGAHCTAQLSRPLDRKLASENYRVTRMRCLDRYFYDTPFSQVEGNHVIHDGRTMLMLASFAYSGLIGNREVSEAATRAIQLFGAGSHGARLVAGTTVLHKQLEQQLARWVSAEDALLFPSGYVTNAATVPALVGPGDTIFADEFNHASLVDGCKLSGAALQTFPHNQVEALERLLAGSPHGRRLVIVDGVYSMEGDIAPLPDIVALCKRYDALLMVDEAHSLGVIGKTGKGVQEHFHLPPDAIDIKMGNTSKALASQGGFIAGTKELVDYLRHHARGYVFSTSLGPPQVAAALKALEILEREPERVAALQRNAAQLANGLRQLGFRITDTQSAIIPLLCKTESQALEMTATCRAAGLFVVPIIYPAVPMNAPRLRLNVMATHTHEQIDHALRILGEAGRAVGLCRSGDQ